MLQKVLEWVVVVGCVVVGGLVIFLGATWPFWVVVLGVVWLIRHW